jgi:hypothetical protein
MSAEVGRSGSWQVLPDTGGAYVQPCIASGYGLHPPAMKLMWLVDRRRHECYLTDVEATSLRVVNLGALETEPGPGAAVEDMSKWTGLSNERLAYALAASRRSLFNWRQGAAVRPDAEARIKRAFQLVRHVAHERPPARVKSWLEAGDPPAIELMRQGLWEELEGRIAEESAPRLVRALMEEPITSADPEVYGAETHRLMLQFFTTPRAAPRRSRRWQPREVTGLGEEEQDEE